MSRSFRRVAALAVLAAGPGCSSSPGAELPLKPCGVEERYLAPDGEEFLAYVHRAYDDQGNHVLNERDYDMDGTIENRFVWEYGPGGLTRERQTSSLGTREVVAEYGDGNRLASVTWMGTLGETGRADYEYDGEERIIEHWDRDGDGTAEESVTYTYDADGKLQEAAFHCGGAAEPVSLTDLIWDAGGLIDRIEYERDGELNGFMEHTYDRDGLLKRRERSYQGMLVSWETYEHDSAGTVREAVFASMYAITMPDVWTRTDTAYDGDGRILSWQYALDGEVTDESKFLYECPDHEDSPGRHVGEPESALPPPPQGPRSGMRRGAISTYIDGRSSCF